jgi:hypothetical protein
MSFRAIDIDTRKRAAGFSGGNRSGIGSPELVGEAGNVDQTILGRDEPCARQGANDRGRGGLEGGRQALCE